MSKFQKKVASVIAGGALLLNMALPVLAQSTTSLVITGNGADSDNTENVTIQSSTTVVQDNTAKISNDVDASSDTGNNDANKNTGGDVTVQTGDASTAVAVSNEANSNVADVNGCCSVDAWVEISGNGADSDNDASLKLKTDTSVFQTNDAKIKNDVDADSDTGSNDAEKNTGGDVTIATGDADTAVVISNKANSNWAQIGNGGGNGSVSLRILGNGADSDNTINLSLARSLTLVQDNFADIKNKVDADSDTGNNDANKNTGGDVTIETGDASTWVGIDNLANFNWADLNCGCLLDVSAKIAGNGWKSDNDINATLSDSKAAFQTNDFVCGKDGHDGWGLDLVDGWDHHPKHKKACNDVDADSDTGSNDAEKNTGFHEGDPTLIETGDAETLVEVATTANSNVLSEGSGPEFPEFDFDFDFDFGSNWALWWGWLGGIVD
ncbi:hypothetical protein HY008_01600 [Candidatus Woesebacteria bacterium]|nr:hypothetical protein [Candidatus Woesebacteria bacterium]